MACRHVRGENRKLSCEKNKAYLAACLYQYCQPIFLSNLWIGREISTYNCSKGAQQKSKLRHSGQHYRTYSKHDEKVKTWRLIDESVVYHRQHSKSQMRHPLLPIPEQFSCIGAAAHLLVQNAAIPRQWWLAYWLRGERNDVDFDDLGLPRLLCMTSIRQAAGCMDLVRLEDAMRSSLSR
jgi:hypothetical protein